MRLKRPYVTTLGDVTITRDGEAAIIAYKDRTVRTTPFTIGPPLVRMTDQEILDRFNETIVATEQVAAQYHDMAAEIPPGRPQIEYFARGAQWTPRGDVLRCVVEDGGPGGMPIIHIDDPGALMGAVRPAPVYLCRLGHARRLRPRRSARWGIGHRRPRAR